MTIRIDGTNTTGNPGITGGDADTGLQFGTDEVKIVTGGSERALVDSSGYLRLAGGGLQFNGDTAAANALDDYEEGTWTPGIEFGGNSVGITYTIQGGWYIKIGKLVTAMAAIQMSNNGTSTGTATYVGLPFNVSSIISGTSLEGGGYAYYQDDVDGTIVGMLNMDAASGTDGGTFRRFATTSDPDTSDTSQVNWTNITNIRFIVQYRTA